MTAALDTRALLRLVAWLSPAFPVGAFAYSSGLERAVHDDLVNDPESLKRWLSVLLVSGSVWNDAVILAAAARDVAHDRQLVELSALAGSLAGSRERYQETVQLGSAFIAAARAWPHPVLDILPPNAPYAVAVGAIAAANGVDTEATIAAFLHAAVSQLISAAIRLGVTGQRDGISVLAALEPSLAELAGRASGSSLDDLGGCALIAEIACLRHETQTTRLFRS